MRRRSLLAAAPWLVTACKKALDLPDMGRVPAFSLPQAGGGLFSSQQLQGKPWVASFMFTHCAGPCPRLNSRLKKFLAESVEFPELELVSFSVDLKRDTPEVLAAYAAKMGADQRRWHFLTADPARPEQMAALQQLARQTFKVGDIDGSLLHTTRVQLVDPQGIYRGSYGTMVSIPGEPDGIEELTRDLEKLKRFYS